MRLIDLDVGRDIKEKWDAKLDSKKRLTIRGSDPATSYHVAIYKNGIIVLEPKEEA